MALPSKYGIDKNMNSMEGLSAYENGGKGSGNFGHSGRPGEVGGSSSGGLSGISKAIAGSKKNIDQAKIVQEDIEDRIGQKVKKGEEYTALDEASSSRFKEFHGEDGTEYTYDKENGMITKTNPETGDQEVVTKQKDSRSWYDDGNFGTAPLIIDEKDGKYKVKSFGDESATRGLLGVDSTISEVAQLPYEKSIKGEKPNEKQQMAFQQVMGIQKLLKQKVSEMGDAMTFKDKKFDFDDFDSVMEKADEFRHSARLKIVGDNSKIGKALEKALTSLGNSEGVLKMIADPDMIKKHTEAQWYDIDDKIKRR